MTTVRALMAAAELTPACAVRWGERPSTVAPGVYLVATTPDPDDHQGLPNCSIDPAAVRALLQVRPDARVDDAPATEKSVTERLAALWVPGEPVVYIGLAGRSVADRVTEYYRTKIGAGAPHAGGWPIKMLATVDALWVHHAPCDDPGAAEQTMLRAFASGLDAETVAALHDPVVVLPYANLELTKGVRKRHGFKRVKEARSSTKRSSSLAQSPAPKLTVAPEPLVTGSPVLTQLVTPTDIADGRIRVPSRTKRLFPATKQQIEIEIFGRRLTCTWDPKLGPDKERSGVISVGRAALAGLVQPGAQLKVTSGGGVIRIG